MISSYAKALAGILVLLAIAVAAAVGYQHGYSFAKAKGALALQTYEQAQQKAEADAERVAAKRYADQVNRADQAEQSLIAVRSQLTQQAQTEKRQIDAVTQTYRKTVDSAPEPVPQCIFTRGFIRLWNAVAGADGSPGAVQGGTAAGAVAAAPDAADTLDSGVSQADVIDWFTDYANRSRRIEAQLNQIIDLQPSNQQGSR